MRSHIEALDSNTRHIGVLFFNRCTFLPALTLHVALFDPEMIRKSPCISDYHWCGVCRPSPWRRPGGAAAARPAGPELQHDPHGGGRRAGRPQQAAAPRSSPQQDHQAQQRRVRRYRLSPWIFFTLCRNRVQYLHGVEICHLVSRVFPILILVP